MIRHTTSLCWFLLVGGCLACLGCGSSTPADDSPTAKAETSASVTKELKPEDIVSQFLDRVRRGGEQSAAGKLLTQKAQAELERIGRTVQPIGSPDAQFKVTRSQAVPGEAGSMLVHSLWSEPSVDGSLTEYQVVWAVERDPVQWRISGLAMEISPGQPPEIIDFENGELMARLLTTAETSSEDPLPQTSPEFQPSLPQFQPSPQSEQAARPQDLRR